MKSIRCTSQNGERIAIRVDSIDYIREYGTGTSIQIGFDNSIEVLESFEVMEQRFDAALALEDDDDGDSWKRTTHD